MKSNAILVRGFDPLDAASVNALAQAAFGEYAQAYEDWPSFIEGIGRMAELASHGDLFVAERGGTVAGAVVHVGPGQPRSPVFPGDWSVIRMLVVAPAYRGQGIGLALVGACLRRARQCGAPAVGLHTSPLMAAALRMYTAIGFERDAELPPIRGVPYGRYVLAADRIDAAIEML